MKNSITGGSEVLLNAASLNLYRNNAFRITGLSINATTRDIANQVEKMEMLKKYGGAFQNSEGYLPVNPLPNEYSIREAMQRLRDPERRMADEFFWFWPNQFEESKNDKAINALIENNIKKATEIWTSQISSGNGASFATHNLAVLFHLTALDFEDFEYNGKPNELSETDKKNRNNCWSKAFKHWSVLLDNEGFWSRLTNRIRQLDDPRLTTGTAKRIRESLPIALLYINAELAVKAAENKNKSDAKRHINIINKSGFNSAVINEALRKAVEPLRKRVNTLCRSANDDDNEPEKAYQVAESLINQTEQSLSVLDIVLPAEHPTREGAHDEVALAALSNIISYANQTEDWKKTLELLKKTLAIAVSESARARIKGNIDIFNENIEYVLEYKTCFFCKGKATILPKKIKCMYCNKEIKLKKKERKNEIFTCPECNKPNDMTNLFIPCKDENAVEVKMHGDVKRSGDRIRWKHITITIPRCEICKKAHDLACILIGGTLGVLLGFGGCSLLSDKSTDWRLLAPIVMGVIGLLLGSIVDRKKTPPDVKKYGTYTNFPRIKELKKKGWKFGEEPPEATQ